MLHAHAALRKLHAVQGPILAPDGQLGFIRGHHDGGDGGLRLLIAGASVCVCVFLSRYSTVSAVKNLLFWRRLAGYRDVNVEHRLLTLLGPQSRFGDRALNFQVVCPQNGAAVLKGLQGYRVLYIW